MPYYVRTFMGLEIWFRPLQGQYSVGSLFDPALSGYTIHHVCDLVRIRSVSA